MMLSITHANLFTETVDINHDGAETVKKVLYPIDVFWTLADNLENNISEETGNITKTISFTGLSTQPISIELDKQCGNLFEHLWSIKIKDDSKYSLYFKHLAKENQKERYNLLLVSTDSRPYTVHTAHPCTVLIQEVQ